MAIGWPIIRNSEVQLLQWNLKFHEFINDFGFDL
jgi:hypothetical protein